MKPLPPKDLLAFSYTVACCIRAMCEDKHTVDVVSTLENAEPLIKNILQNDKENEGLVTIPIRGESGNVKLEYAFAQAMKQGFKLFCKKQNDYGPNNVGAFGLRGLAVRLNDKVQRLWTLSSTPDPMNEALEDTCIDIVNYGAIALLVLKNLWPEFTGDILDMLKALEKEINEDAP